MLAPMLRRHRFLLVLAVLLIWAGLGLNILLMSHSPPASLGLLNLTPGAVMGATWYLARSQSTPAWNHGYSYGLAFNAEPTEIVYWTKDW
ncbi:MAG: hypothetical protein AAFX01_05945 [Cyanobacteria bacterium J06638_28]